MNDIEKSSTEKKPGRWALLEACFPAMMMLAAICSLLEAYTRLEIRHQGHAIVPLVCSAVFSWAAFYWVIVRLRSGSSR